MLTDKAISYHFLGLVRVLQLPIAKSFSFQDLTPSISKCMSVSASKVCLVFQGCAEKRRLEHWKNERCVYERKSGWKPYLLHLTALLRVQGNHPNRLLSALVFRSSVPSLAAVVKCPAEAQKSGTECVQMQSGQSRNESKIVFERVGNFNLVYLVSFRIYSVDNAKGKRAKDRLLATNTVLSERKCVFSLYICFPGR